MYFVAQNYIIFHEFSLHLQLNLSIHRPIMSENTKKHCGVLFDLDGVLLDSEGQYTIFWGAMEEEY